MNDDADNNNVDNDNHVDNDIHVDDHHGIFYDLHVVDVDDDHVPSNTNTNTNHDKPETDQAVISLNVGGSLYDVSRSLLEQYPDTMLARLVSKTWYPGDPTTKGSKKAVFIERNGSRFGLVLDYLRDGSVNLPISVSKSAFINDLDYYGVAYNDQCIHGIGTVASVVALGLLEADQLRESARVAKERADYCQLANEIFAEYCRSGRLKFNPVWIAGNTVFEQSHLIQSAMLAPHMVKYGLEVRGDPQTDWEGCLVLGHLSST